MRNLFRNIFKSNKAKQVEAAAAQAQAEKDAKPRLPNCTGGRIKFEYQGANSVRLYTRTHDCLLQGEDCTAFYDQLEAIDAVVANTAPSMRLLMNSRLTEALLESYECLMEPT